MRNPGVSRRGIERAHVFGSLNLNKMFETPCRGRSHSSPALKSSRFWVSMTSPQKPPGTIEWE